MEIGGLEIGGLVKAMLAYIEVGMMERIFWSLFSSC